MDLGAADFVGALHHEQTAVMHGLNNLWRQRPCVFRGSFVALDNRRDTLDTAEQRLQQLAAIAGQWSWRNLGFLARAVSLKNAHKLI